MEGKREDKEEEEGEVEEEEEEGRRVDPGKRWWQFWLQEGREEEEDGEMFASEGRAEG